GQPARQALLLLRLRGEGRRLPVRGGEGRARLSRGGGVAGRAGRCGARARERGSAGGGVAAAEGAGLGAARTGRGVRPALPGGGAEGGEVEEVSGGARTR